MAGWFDNWRRVRGWSSAYNAAIGGPYYVDKRQLYTAGAIQGEQFVAGPAKSQLFHAGAIQGEADGRS